MNEHDIQAFLDQGGMIKDLINPVKFNKLYKQISDEVSE